jgi:hypothetical protein
MRINMEGHREITEFSKENNLVFLAIAYYGPSGMSHDSIELRILYCTVTKLNIRPFVNHPEFTCVLIDYVTSLENHQKKGGIPLGLIGLSYSDEYPNGAYWQNIMLFPEFKDDKGVRDYLNEVGTVMAYERNKDMWEKKERERRGTLRN